ncbi:MAG: hypothetical protein V1882_11290, partial [Candidatus Omnitrophota bacterium]
MTCGVTATYKTASRPLKTVAFLTLVFFTVTNLAYGQALPLSFAGKLPGEVRVPSFVQGLQIPPELGTLRQVHAGGPSTVILLQDAHSQTGAQRHIEGILKYLNTREGFGALFLEGAFRGPVSKELLHFTKDPRSNREIAERFLDKGLIGGGGLYLLGSSKGTAAYGVEDPDLYIKNLKQFRKIYQSKAEMERFLTSAEQKLVSQSSRVMGPELRKFHEEWRAFLNSRREIPAFYDLLAQYAKRLLRVDLKDAWSQFDYPQLVRFFKLRALEAGVTGDDEKAVEKETKALRSWLRTHKSPSGSEIATPPKTGLAMTAMGLSLRTAKPRQRRAKTEKQSGLKSEIATPQRTGLAMTAGVDKDAERVPFEEILKAGEASSVRDPRAYFEDFFAAHHASGFTFERYPALTRRIGKLILCRELDAAGIQEETEQLTERVLAHLTRTADEKKLVKLFRDLQLLKKLFALELSKKEYDEARVAGERLRPSRVLRGLSLGSGLRAMDATFRQALEFYETASRREDVMFAHLLKTLRAEKPERSVLITGGFHTGGLEARLKAGGFS